VGENGQPGPGADGDRDERSLGQKVEWLIQHRWPVGAPEPKTNDDIAEAIVAATGEHMSGTAVWKLRTDRGGRNPTFNTLTALARFFDVPFGYFGEGEAAESIADGAALAAMLREKGITRAALRSLGDLSSESRQMITEMIESAARMEQSRSGQGRPGARRNAPLKQGRSDRVSEDSGGADRP
jgi:transcriptional regulator with XRE-family HTH domain